MTPPPVPVYRTRSLFLLGEEQRRLFELVQEELSTHHEVTRETRALAQPGGQTETGVYAVHGNLRHLAYDWPDGRR
jgi:hypothetical protein